MKPYSTRALIAALAFLMLAVSLPAGAGIVVAREFRSAALERNWSYAVYLPDGYETSNLRIVNGAHVWAVWESTIGDAMKYIFRYAARPAVSGQEK